MKKLIYILLTAAAIITATPLKAQIKIGNYRFDDGSEYSGELKGRRPHGKGRTIYINGDIYEGQYRKGRRHGQGTFISKEGEK